MDEYKIRAGDLMVLDGVIYRGYNDLLGGNGFWAQPRPIADISYDTENLTPEQVDEAVYKDHEMRISYIFDDVKNHCLQKYKERHVEYKEHIKKNFKEKYPEKFVVEAEGEPLS